MGLSRLIILVAIIWLGWFLYQRYQQKIVNQLQKGMKKKEIKSAVIVKCVACGLHVPKGEAIEDNGKFYCSTDHKNL